MKKTLLLLCALFGLSVAASAQQNYRPLVEEGKTWTFRHEVDGMEIPNGKFTYTLQGDTVIAGKAAKKGILKIEDEENVYVEYPAAMYEENKKVYINSSTTEEWRLIYDFGLTIGQSGEIGNGENGAYLGTLKLEERTARTPEGEYLYLSLEKGYSALLGKTFYPKDATKRYKWITGVGSSKSLLNNYDTEGMLGVGGERDVLLSCTVNGVELYNPTTDGIAAASIASAPKGVYDLTGRQLSAAPAHGVYIENGVRKVK